MRSLAATLATDPIARVAAGLFLFLFALFLFDGSGESPLVRGAGALAPVVLLLAAFQWGRSRILQKEERTLWNLLTWAFVLWLLVSVLRLIFQDQAPTPLAARLAIDLLSALYYLAVLLAIERPLDRRPGLHRADLGWVQQGPGAAMFIVGLLIYFTAIPAYADLESWRAKPGFWMVLILDTYVVTRLALLWAGTRSLRWQMLGFLLFISFLALLAADLLSHLYLGEPAAEGSALASFSSFALCSLAFLFLILSVRLRHHPFPPQQSLFDSIRRKDELPWPRGRIVTFALAFPVIHLVVATAAPGDDPSRGVRDLFVLAWLALVGGLALAQQRLLERKARSLWIERMRAEEALHKSEETLRLVHERMQIEEALRVSEEKFAKVFRASPDSVVIVTVSDGRFLDVNDGTEAITGYSREELLGRTALDMKLWNAPLARQHLMKTLEERGMVRDFELELRKKGGEICACLLSAEPLELDDEECLLIIVRDVTERRAAQDKIEEQAALLDKARDAILVLDLDDRIIYWNKSAERLYGWTADEIHDHTADEILYDRPPPELLEARDGMMGRGEWTGELEQVNRHGERIVVESRWTLVRANNGRPKYQMAINTDVTAKKRLEKQLLRSQRMESVATLAGGLAHDLNNVLTPVVMTVHLLRHKWPPGVDTSLLSTLETNALRSATMVEEVMSLARGVEGERQMLDITGLVDDHTTELRRVVPDAIQVQSRCMSELWPVTGDRSQLRRVLGHLSDNARDALSGSGNLLIEAENVHLDELYAEHHLGAKAGPYVAISMSDTGIGITPEVLDKIFDPFFTTKGMGRGTGLGLSSSATIVRSHGGFMTVYSEPGNGSKIQVFLPATLTPEIEESDTALPQLPVGHGETVLVIDDETPIREISEQTLEMFGYNVLLAESGEEALEIYDRHRSEIDLVMLDMLMPGMDGEATLTALRERDPTVRVIICSGLSLEIRSKELEVAAFLPKPFTAERLLTTLRSVLIAGEASTGG